MVTIARFEVLRVPPSWVWLKIHASDGTWGIGEPYLEGQPEAVIAEVRRLEQLLIGEDPRRIEYLWERMYTVNTGYRGGPVTMSAISGIDIALWDLAGKLAGLPVYQMLGGACRDRVKMYHAAGGGPRHSVTPGLPYRAGRPPAPPRDPRDPRDPHGLDRVREGARVLVQEWGFRALKVHFGPGEGLEATAQVNAIAARFAAVREGAGPGVDVAVDIHNPHPAVAAQLIAALAPHRPLFVEEPMPIERVDVLAQLAAQATAPLAAGERWMGKWMFFDAISRGALAVVQPDIAHAGGITECKKIAAIAEAGYAKVALHCPISPVALAASIQLDAALPNFLVQEHNEVNTTRRDGRTLIGEGYLAEPFALDADGCVAVPTGPGLGIALDDAGLAEIMRHSWSTTRG